MMNKADYIVQGRADFLAGKKRAGSAKAKNSWQENAYDTGYNAALREHAVATQGAPIEATGEARATLAEPVAVKFKTLSVGQRFKGQGWTVSFIKLSDTEAGETDGAGNVNKLHRLGRNERVIPVAAMVAHPTGTSLACVAHIRTTQAAKQSGMRRMAESMKADDRLARAALAQTTDNTRGKA